MLDGSLGDSLGGSSEASVTRRLAGTIFIIRVVSAALAYLSQILLARWMGGSDYGAYVYVWTWVLLLGSMMDFGISASAQKIIPEYRTRGETRAAARLSLRQPLDDLCRVFSGFSAARRCREDAVAVD
jgi:O-antigen/teichoic acid export membrane protein